MSTSYKAYQVQDYLPLGMVHPFHGWTLDGAWDHGEPWRFLEEHGDIIAAFGDLFRTNKDASFNVVNAIHYGMVNT